MKNICVFCGSRVGNKSIYKSAAQEMGYAIAKRGFGLIYGGGHTGLMGVVADAALTAGTEVIGVIPQFLLDREQEHGELTKLHIVNSMHERKAMMAELADAFIALPGGYGTLEELCEVITWAQLGLHNKPIGLLNVDGYYNFLLNFFDRTVTEEFLAANLRHLVIEGLQPEVLLDLIMQYQPQQQQKLMSRESEI